MREKRCLVTGATAGIGLHAAKALAEQGAQVIITGRNRQKAEAVSSRIKRETGNDRVSYLLADYVDLEQVRQLAVTFIDRYDRLDVLLNNAGAFFNRRHETAYPVERTMLVNHMAPFLLTQLLLPVLGSAGSARIVNVSSDAHKLATMDFDDLSFHRRYSGIKAYGRSKLANIMFTYELARRLEGSRVMVNAVHPGHVATDIWRNEFGVIGPLLKRVMSLFALSPEDGADPLVYLASAPELARVSGRYFSRREPTPSSPLSYDEEIGHHLWELSAQWVGLEQPQSVRGGNIGG